MAWVRCCGGSAKVNFKDIIVNGELNDAYIATGSYTEDLVNNRGIVGYIGAQIQGVDFTNLTNLAIDQQTLSQNWSRNLKVTVGNMTISATGGHANRYTLNLDVSSLTGVLPIDLTVQYGQSGDGVAIYNLIAS